MAISSLLKNRRAIALLFRHPFLYFIQVHKSTLKLHYNEFVGVVNVALHKLMPSQSMILLGDFDARIGVNDVTRNNVIGSRRHPELDSKEKCSLQGSIVYITNTLPMVSRL